jgi:hypothetical protein
VPSKHIEGKCASHLCTLIRNSGKIGDYLALNTISIIALTGGNWGQRRPVLKPAFIIGLAIRITKRYTIYIIAITKLVPICLYYIIE